MFDQSVRRKWHLAQGARTIDVDLAAAGVVHTSADLVEVGCRK